MMSRTFVGALLIMSLLPIAALAQEFDMMRMMRSPSNREYHKDANRERYLALWNGNGAVISARPLWTNEAFRQELNFTPEQLTQLDFMFSKEGSMGHWYQTKRRTDPVLDKMLSEHEPLNAEMRKNDPYGDTTPLETQRVYHDQLRAMTAYYFTETQKDVENLLTPEQMQKVRESELALMSEEPILNPSMFESLGLTDDQREQMSAIKKELEPAFLQLVEELVEAEDASGQLKFDLFEAVGIKIIGSGKAVDENGRLLEDNPEAMKEKMKLMEKKMSENVEFRTRMERLSERGKSFMKGFQTKMLDVLTDEQLTAMQRIIDNPTKYVKRLRDEQRAARAEQDKQENTGWQPGPDSWRPGDPLPAEFLKQRQERQRSGRFPRAEPAEKEK
jgi:hypothetical protein